LLKLEKQFKKNLLDSIEIGLIIKFLNHHNLFIPEQNFINTGDKNNFFILKSIISLLP